MQHETWNNNQPSTTNIADENNESSSNNRNLTEALLKEDSMAETHTKVVGNSATQRVDSKTPQKKVKLYRTIKHNNQPRCMIQKELTNCNFTSNFCNYSLSQMPSDGKLIASQFRFQIRMGLVLAK